MEPPRRYTAPEPNSTAVGCIDNQEQRASPLPAPRTMEMPMTPARAALSLWDLATASSVADTTLQHDTDDLHASFSVLFEAITTTSPLPTHSQPTTAPTKKPTTKAPVGEDKVTQRRERNRLSCRKARLKRKLERLGESQLVQRREERQADLLDLRDGLTAAASVSEDPTRAMRMFVAKSLHYALLDDKYLAVKQHALSSERAALGWPTRALTTSMVKQWKHITSDLINAHLTIEEIDETTGGNGKKEMLMQCTWTLRGVSLSGVESRYREEPSKYDGKTHLRFVDDKVVSIELSATAVEAEAQRPDTYQDDEAESEPEEEGEAYAVMV